MKTRKGLVLTAIVLFGALFFAFRTIGGGMGAPEMVTLQQRLLNAVGALLEQEHFSPKAINKYNDRKRAIGCGISKLDLIRPAKAPNTKKRMAGSRKLFTAI